MGVDQTERMAVANWNGLGGANLHQRPLVDRKADAVDDLAGSWAVRRVTSMVWGLSVGMLPARRLLSPCYSEIVDSKDTVLVTHRKAIIDLAKTYKVVGCRRERCSGHHGDEQHQRP